MTEQPKPTVPEVRPLVQEYHDTHPAGGNFHIYLRDGNYNRRSIEFCIEQAFALGDAEGVGLGKLLLRMSDTQRRKIYRSLIRGG